MPYTTPPVIVEQSLAAGGQWDGSRPSGTFTDVDGVRIYAAEAAVAGGRFKAGELEDIAGAMFATEFDTPHRYLLIERVILDMTGLAGAATWNVEIVTAAGTRILWLTGAGGNFFVLTNELKLGPDEWIELTTSVAAAAACVARIMGRSLGIAL